MVDRFSKSDEPGRARDANRKRAVLVGAGHAHLEAIRRAGEFTRRGFELVVVSPGPFWYSGLATGMLGGQYPPSLDQIDVAGLVARGGGRFVCDRATALDARARTVTLERSESLRYDVVSLNVGSEVPAESIPGLTEFATLVKPLGNLWRLRQELVESLALATPDRPVRVVVVGGGASGCELAGNLKRLADAHGGSVQIRLLAAGARLLETASERAAKAVERSLQTRGVIVATNARVVRVERDAAISADERRNPFDFLIAAIGLRPPPWLRASGLPTDEDGALLVDPFLRSVADPAVFGGGDCVAFGGRALAKIGVYAVREAPVLCDNLLATLEYRPLRPFRPQRRYLLILNLGDGTGLATWGPLFWHGRLPFWIKDRIDRRFLRRYSRGQGSLSMLDTPGIGRDSPSETSGTGLETRSDLGEQ
jgi:NADH dehydrogenase FAD-containing subunit